MVICILTAMKELYSKTNLSYLHFFSKMVYLCKSEINKVSESDYLTYFVAGLIYLFGVNLSHGCYHICVYPRFSFILKANKVYCYRAFSIDPIYRFLHMYIPQTIRFKQRQYSRSNWIHLCQLRKRKFCFRR